MTSSMAETLVQTDVVQIPPRLPLQLDPFTALRARASSVHSHCSRHVPVGRLRPSQNHSRTAAPVHLWNVRSGSDGSAEWHRANSSRALSPGNHPRRTALVPGSEQVAHNAGWAVDSGGRTVAVTVATFSPRSRTGRVCLREMCQPSWPARLHLRKPGDLRALDTSAPQPG